MKQIVSNYSYSPATNVVTLSGVNIDADQLLLIVAPQVGRTLYNFASVTGTVSAGADTRVSLNASTAGLTTTSPLVIFYDDQASAQTVTGTVALDPASLVALENVTVTIGSSVTVGGTVTANVGGIASGVTIPVRLFAEAESGPSSGQDTLLNCDSGGQLLVNLKSGGASVLGYDGNAFVQVKQVSGSSVTIGSLPAISGTVTAIAQGINIGGTNQPMPLNIAEAEEGFGNGRRLAVSIIGNDGSEYGTGGLPLSVAGTVTASVPILTVATHGASPLASPIQTAIGVFNTNNPNQILGVFGAEESEGEGISAFVSVRNPISGTVTANNPSGALTTRFGSVATANLAFITSAVTNTSRKYLLAQNISAGTVTIGIGFSPTTTQGIQLTAGAGLTFDAFCPTGAVYWLGAVTGAAFTILEG